MSIFSRPPLVCGHSAMATQVNNGKQTPTSEQTPTHLNARLKVIIGNKHQSFYTAKQGTHCEQFLNTTEDNINNMQWLSYPHLHVDDKPLTTSTVTWHDTSHHLHTPFQIMLHISPSPSLLMTATYNNTIVVITFRHKIQLFQHTISIFKTHIESQNSNLNLMFV